MLGEGDHDKGDKKRMCPHAVMLNWVTEEGCVFVIGSFCIKHKAELGQPFREPSAAPL